MNGCSPLSIVLFKRTPISIHPQTIPLTTRSHTTSRSAHVGSRNNFKFTMPMPDSGACIHPTDMLSVPDTERHEAHRNTPHMRMIESLLPRSARSLYAFNPSEWKAQCDTHETEFGKDILAEFASFTADLFTLPYFSTSAHAKGVAPRANSFADFVNHRVFDAPPNARQLASVARVRVGITLPPQSPALRTNLNCSEE